MIVKLGPDGTVRIPPELLECLGLKEGDSLTVRLDRDGISLIGLDAAYARARALVKHYVPEDVSLAVSLIADRRRRSSCMRSEARRNCSSMTS